MKERPVTTNDAVCLEAILDRCQSQNKKVDAVPQTTGIVGEDIQDTNSIQ
jgi:hypothetical protein